MLHGSVLFFAACLSECEIDGFVTSLTSLKTSLAVEVSDDLLKFEKLWGKN
jgi:hypothetical protein